MKVPLIETLPVPVSGTSFRVDNRCISALSAVTPSGTRAASPNAIALERLQLLLDNVVDWCRITFAR
jgi:hypothetical protein